MIIWRLVAAVAELLLLTVQQATARNVPLLKQKR